MKKTKILSRLDIICGAASALVGIVLLLLLSLGVIYRETGTGLDGGLTKGLGVLFFALFFVAESIVSVYLIIEGIFVRAMLKRSKSIKVFAIINAILKILLAIPFSVLTTILFSLIFWEGAVFALTYSVMLVILSVFGFVAGREKITEITVEIPSEA